jgi:ribosomal protein S17E
MLNKLFKTDRHKEFWKWFTKHQDDFYQFETNKEVLSDLLEKKLKDINEDLAFEITTVKNDGKRELSISTDGERKASKDVIDLVNKAPVLNNWNLEHSDKGFQEVIFK